MARRKRTLLALAVALLCLCAAACGSQPAEPAAEPTVTEEPAAQEPAAAEPAAAEPVPEQPAGSRVTGINAYIDGWDELLITEPGVHLAQVVLPEGMAVDHWEVNGIPVENPDRRFSLEFAAEGDTIVSAVLRPERKLTSINAVMQFINEKGRPDGPTFDEFVFEYDYVNMANDETYPGGTITVQVEADVPKGYDIDYWRINGVPYLFKHRMKSFIVVNMDDSAVYEAVLKEKGADETDPDDIMNGPGTTAMVPGDTPITPGTPPGGATPPDDTTPPGGTTPPGATPPGGTTPPGATPPGGDIPKSGMPTPTPTPKPKKHRPKATPTPAPTPTPTPYWYDDDDDDDDDYYYPPNDPTTGDRTDTGGQIIIPINPDNFPPVNNGNFVIIQ